jgi:hypothetical protein
MATIATHSSTTAISPVIPVRSIGHVMSRRTIDFAMASILPAQGERRESARGFCGVTAPLSPRFGIRLVTHNVADRKRGCPCPKMGSGRGIDASFARGTELVVLGVYSSELERIGGLLAEEGPEGRATIAGPVITQTWRSTRARTTRTPESMLWLYTPAHRRATGGSSRPSNSSVTHVAADDHQSHDSRTANARTARRANFAVTCGCGPRHNGREPASSRPLWSAVQRIADRVRVDSLRE